VHRPLFRCKMLGMKAVATYLTASLLGCGLFFLGWSGVDKPGSPFVDQDQTTIVVRPAQAETGWDGAVVKNPDASDPLGVRYLPADARKVLVRRDSWGSQSAENPRPGEMRTVRLSAPPAKLDPRTSDGTAIKLVELPSKVDKPREAGYIRVPPGRYKFLATAVGHIPQTIDLTLSAGQVQNFTVDLKKIPIPLRPAAASTSVSPPPTTRPSSPAHYPARPAPQPRYQPAPRPQPRFTPVAPAPPPRIAQPVPEPVFTPFP
jgi:hypothetical protein